MFVHNFERTLPEHSRHVTWGPSYY